MSNSLLSNTSRFTCQQIVVECQDSVAYDALVLHGARGVPSTMSDARRLRMLLIDDDQNVRQVLAHLLASFGYECQVATDGVSGLALFDKGEWDLVLLDIAMPAMSGWTVVETIRRRAPTL